MVDDGDRLSASILNERIPVKRPTTDDELIQPEAYFPDQNLEELETRAVSTT